MVPCMSANSCHTTLTCRRRSAMGMAVTGLPSTNTWPLSGSSIRVTRRSSELFPAPLGPTTAVIPPRGKCRVMSCSTRFSAL